MRYYNESGKFVMHWGQNHVAGNHYLWVTCVFKTKKKGNFQSTRVWEVTARKVKYGNYYTGLMGIYGEEDKSE